MPARAAESQRSPLRHDDLVDHELREHRHEQREHLDDERCGGDFHDRPAIGREIRRELIERGRRLVEIGEARRRAHEQGVARPALREIRYRDLHQPSCRIRHERPPVVDGVHDDPVKALPVDQRRQVVVAQVVEGREDRQRLEPELPRRQHEVEHRCARRADPRELTKTVEADALAVGPAERREAGRTAVHHALLPHRGMARQPPEALRRRDGTPAAATGARPRLPRGRPLHPRRWPCPRDVRQSSHPGGGQPSVSVTSPRNTSAAIA